MVNLFATLTRKAVSIFSSTNFSYINQSFNPETNGVISEWVLLLPGGGCSWAKDSGGCYMCGFSSKIREVNKGHAVSHKRLMLIQQMGEAMVAGQNKEQLTIYNGGNFLNDQEIPVKTQMEMCIFVEKHPTIKKLFIESRPEFVTPKKIQLLTSLLGDKVLEVGIGLECADDNIRDRCIHKGFSRKDYELAIDVLKNYGAKVLTYVFLKPLYLTEKEAIEEAVHTIKYSFGARTNQVALESAFIQEGTTMEKLYNQGEYKLPWLWSVIEVVRRTHHLGPIKIGRFEDEPPPIAIPTNCDKCSKTIMDLFAEYDRTHNFKVFDDLDCDCKSVWQKEN